MKAAMLKKKLYESVYGIPLPEEMNKKHPYITCHMLLINDVPVTKFNKSAWEKSI